MNVIGNGALRRWVLIIPALLLFLGAGIRPAHATLSFQSFASYSTGIKPRKLVVADFNVDGRAGIRNPRGMTCARLEANVHVISALSHDHNALIAAMHQAHLAVEETISEAVAAAFSCLLEDDRKQGVALVDIGGERQTLPYSRMAASATPLSCPSGETI